MKNKLSWKLTVIFCSILILAVSTGYIYLASRLKAYFENNIHENLRNQLILGRDFLEASLNNSTGAVDYQAAAVEIGRALGLRATIIARDGKVLGDTDLNREQLSVIENHGYRPEIRDALKKGFGVSRRFSYTLKEDMIYMAVPFGKENAQGTIRLAVTLRSVELLEAKMRGVIWISLFFIVLLGLGLNLAVSIFISRPLTEISAVAMAMAKGDFSKRAGMYSGRQIKELAGALNFMSGEIKDKIEKLDSERAKLDVVLRSMFEGLVVTDEDGKIILMNPSLRKLFLVDSEPEGKKLTEIIRNTAIFDIMERIMSGRKQLVSEEIVITAPEERVLKINCVPIVRNNKFEGAILVFHDITELRRLEKIRQDFVANVSHELRTPVSSIKGYAETLLEGGLDDKDNLREFISVIYQDAERLANLISDLLDLSRIESGKMGMSFFRLDPVSVIRRAVTIMDNQAKAKSITIKINTTQGLPEIKADEAKLFQVVINLLDNAIKYTPERGSVIISAGVNDNMLQIDISDTGIGIAEEDLPRIFERFYRVDKARSRELGGIGLGLSIVKHIVQSHGGQVWVKSEIGRGSLFSFTIPLA